MLEIFVIQRKRNQKSTSLNNIKKYQHTVWKKFKIYKKNKCAG